MFGTTVPGARPAAGWVGIVSADNLQAGTRTAYSGQLTRTGIADGVTKIAIDYGGYDDYTAQRLGDYGALTADVLTLFVGASPFVYQSARIAPRAGVGSTVDNWLAAGSNGGLRRQAGAWRLNNYRNESTRFYSVLDPQDTTRLLAGGDPWPPLSPSKANLGEGFYTWADRTSSQTYLDNKPLFGSFDPLRGTAVKSFRIGNRELQSYRQIDLREYGDAFRDNWMNTHAAYDTWVYPHGYQYVIYPRAMGAEHFFDRSIFADIYVRP